MTLFLNILPFLTFWLSRVINCDSLGNDVR